MCACYDVSTDKINNNRFLRWEEKRLLSVSNSPYETRRRMKSHRTTQRMTLTEREDKNSVHQSPMRRPLTWLKWGCEMEHFQRTYWVHVLKNMKVLTKKKPTGYTIGSQLKVEPPTVDDWIE